MGEIYLVTNKVNGKQYVGQTTRTMKFRKEGHEGNARNGGRRYFHNALRKHGFDAFAWTILMEEDDERWLNRWEQFYIKRLNTKVPNGYNLNDGGEGSSNPSVEIRGKMSKAAKERKRSPLSLETRNKISLANKGRKLSKASRKKLSETLSGKVPSPESNIKRSLTLTGKPWTEKRWEACTKARLEREAKKAADPLALLSREEKISRALKGKSSPKPSGFSAMRSRVQTELWKSQEYRLMMKEARSKCCVG